MMSLEKLLAEDGFKKKGKMKAGSRVPAAPRAVSMPLYPDREHNPLFRNVDSGIRRGMASSDVYTGRSEPISLESERVRGVRYRSRLARRGSSDDGRDAESREAEDIEPRNSNDVQEAEGSNGRFQVRRSNEIEEIEEYGGNEIQEIEEPRVRYPDKFKINQSYKQKYWNNLYEDEKFRSGKERKFQATASFSNDLRGRRHDDLKNSDSEPPLDEAAIQAVVAILTGYIRRFIKDEKFRASIRYGCYTCLGIINGAKESHHKGSGAVINLREAITTVERVVQQVQDPMDLRKASLKLSVITSLSSKDLKDGYTSGIPNSHLTACAHLYLSVIYKLQKKDRFSVKHLLQVFCESPYQARTTLLPRLWEDIFLPYLSHLRAWYNKETDSTAKTSSRTKRMKLLDKVYNNTLDMGTYKFAVYYMKWLMEEAEAPKLPSILIPSTSFPRISLEEFHSASSDGISSPRASVSSQATVSKKLYESVFGRSKKMEAYDEMKSRGEEEVEEEVEEVQLTRVMGSYGSDNTSTYSPKPGMHREEHVQDDHDVCSPNPDESPDTLQVDEWTGKGSSRLDIPEAKENELTLKKLAQAAFHPVVEDQSFDVDAIEREHSADSPVYDLYQTNLSKPRYTESELKNNGMVSTKSHINSFVLNSSAEPSGNFEDTDHGSLFISIPKDFICPLTGQLLEDPVTLETGKTFERVAIKEWFNRGNRKCPLTGRALEYLSVPVTNFVLKRVIDDWKSEYCKNLLVFATQIAGNESNDIKKYSKSKDESALSIIEQLLTGFSIKEQLENAKHLLSLGGLQFLLRRLELGNLEEKTRVVSLMLCCVKADGSCRSYLAMNISRSCILELLHSKQITARSNAVLLLIELMCLNRRTAITSFVSGLQTEAIVNTMHVLLVYLQCSPPEERVLVAVLLLHLDLMGEPRRYSIYREEAVNSIIVALECCLSDEKVIANTQRALLMLSGHFFSSGEILTETWLLKEAGFYDGSGIVSVDYEDEVDEMVIGEEESKEREEWLKNVSLVLLGNGKRSFLEILSKCLGSKNPEFVRTCLITAAWLSRALSLLSVAEIQLSALSALVPRLKESLASGQQIEHRVLACISLLSFSKISDCRAMLMASAKEICDPLKSLMGATWAAKHLYTAIAAECREHEERIINTSSSSSSGLIIR